MEKTKQMGKEIKGEALLPDDGSVDVVEGDGDGDRLVLHHKHHVRLVRDHRSLLEVRT